MYGVGFASVWGADVQVASSFYCCRAKPLEYHVQQVEHGRLGVWFGVESHVRGCDLVVSEGVESHL